MKITAKLYILAPALALLTACAGAQEFKPLIQGENLEDTFIQRGGNATYELKDGTIIGRTAPKQRQNAFLCTKKEYGDFELELEFKVDPRLNSGVQVRSNSDPAYKNGRVHGYQVEIDPSPRSYSAGVYDEARRGWLKDLKDNPEARNAFKPGEWNKLWISFRGDTLRTKINDVPAVEVKDDMTSRGFIAFQVHSTTSTEPLEVMWRNIRIIDWDKVKTAQWETNSPMGDYEGETPEGKKVVAQVWDKGDDKFHARLLPDFESRQVLAESEGKMVDGKIEFETSAGNGTLDGDKLTIKKSDGTEFVLSKTVRKSPTEGAKAPEGAVVLFDGSNLDGWQTIKGEPSRWKLADNGSMEVVAKTGNHETKETFGDMELHLEFRTPLMPHARGQQRANSGVYVQGSYEVQVLDSYALDGADNECGGIYKVGAPKVNMAYPPLQWQTYDISFKAAKWDGDRKTENARITLKHNGVVVQDSVELPDATGGAKQKGEPKTPGPLMLQDHGDPVQFRNIWAVRGEAGQ